MHRPSKPMLVLALLAAAGLLASCSQPPQPVRPEVRYYLESSQSLHAIHRVVFIQLDGGTRHPQIASVMTEALFAALQDRGIFQVDVMSEDHPQCQDLPLRSREGFTIEQLNAIRQALRCDAVLLGEVTQFLPHPRMQAGLSLRLIDLKNGQLVWGVENVWDSTDLRVEKRIEDFFEDRMRHGYEPVDECLAYSSPRTFGKFVAYEVSNTLPSRGLQPPPPTPAQRSASRAWRKVRTWAAEQVE